MPTNSGTQTTEQSDDRMHGAAIVDDKGQEIPITEDMIQTALQNILKTVEP